MDVNAECLHVNMEMLEVSEEARVEDWRIEGEMEEKEEQEEFDV